MANIEEIKTELTTDPIKGLNSYQAGYVDTNTVQQNLDLINGMTVERYAAEVDSNKIKDSFVPAELMALVTQDRADFGEFITNLYLHDLTVVNPSGNLKALIDGIVGGVSATNFDAAIRELVSPAIFQGIGPVNFSEMEEAMNQLGWI